MSTRSELDDAGWVKDYNGNYHLKDWALESLCAEMDCDFDKKRRYGYPRARPPIMVNKSEWTTLPYWWGESWSSEDPNWMPRAHCEVEPVDWSFDFSVMYRAYQRMAGWSKAYASRVHASMNRRKVMEMFGGSKEDADAFLSAVKDSEARPAFEW